MGFTTFGLSDHVLKGIESAGYVVPTPIQSITIGPSLEGNDIIGCAQTGTGKTAAFVLPILHRLSEGSRNGSRHPRALVMTPTRELARQVDEAFGVYGRHTTIRSVAIYGGTSMTPQLKALRRGVDVIVSTPGRLLDHLERGSIDLSAIEIVVLDEADRMLDMGFIHDMKRILRQLPTERQTLLFSATVSDDIRSLAGAFLRDPKILRVGERSAPAETVKQFFYAVDKGDKQRLLVHVINSEKMGGVLVFSRTKHGADKIMRRLAQQGISSTALHSNRTQGQRQRSLDGFRDGQYRALVATDIAARGIDIDRISHVVNFDIPRYAEDYVHRIGRTGRAGASGDAITFVGQDDRQYLTRIEKFTGRRIDLRPYTGFTRGTEDGNKTDRPKQQARQNRSGNQEGAWTNQPSHRGARRRFSGKAGQAQQVPGRRKKRRQNHGWSPAGQ